MAAEIHEGHQPPRSGLPATLRRLRAYLQPYRAQTLLIFALLCFDAGFAARSGKSSVLGLLLRFHEPASGAITVDGAGAPRAVVRGRCLLLRVCVRACDIARGGQSGSLDRR